MHVSSLSWIDSFLRVIKKFLRAFEICTAIPLYYSIAFEYDSLYRSHIRRSILRFHLSTTFLDVSHFEQAATFYSTRANRIFRSVFALN